MQDLTFKLLFGALLLTAFILFDILIFGLAYMFGLINLQCVI